MIKRLLALWICSIIGVATLCAQERTIHGHVVDQATNDPLIGANVVIKGSDIGTITDTEGHFSLEASTGNMLVISYVGYGDKEITVDAGQSDYFIALGSGEVLDEMVITALGLSKEKKALGYSVNEMNADDIRATGQTNVVGALQGRTPGVQVLGSSGAPGAALDIVIRGITSLDPNRSNRPLYVIDGIEVSDDVDVATNVPSGISYGLSTSSRTQTSTSNRMIDINPDDIANISVLKGAAATALYGVRAANGAIIITTKKGKTGTPTISIDYGIGWSEVNKYPKVQTEYIDGHVNTSLKRGYYWDNWGAHVESETTSDPKNIYKEFYQTGQMNDVGLSISAGTDKFKYRFSGGYSGEDGIIPLSSLKRANLNLSTQYQVSDRFDIDASIFFTNTRQNTPHEGRKSIMNVIGYMANTADPTYYEKPYTYGNNFAAGIIDHPLFLAEHVTNEGDVNRYLMSAGASYDVLENLSLNYRIGIDNYDDSRERIVHPETDEGQSAVSPAPFGFVAINDINRTAITSNLFAQYQSRLSSDLHLSLTLGHYLFGSNRKTNSVIGAGFVVENFFNLNNTSRLEQTNSDIRYRNAAVYGEATLGFRNYVYLTLTGRNDWSSTLPKENRSYFFPSASLSWVISDMTNLSGIDLLKLRGSYAVVGKDALPYQIGQYYNSTLRFGDIVGYSSSTLQGDPNLKPEFSHTIEVGAEIAILKNRLGLDVSYYNNRIEDMIQSVPVAIPSGISRYVTNAGSIVNEGVEFLIYGDILKKKDGLNWTATVNFGKNVGTVKEISTGSEENEIIVEDNDRNVTNKLVVGGKIADLYGNPFLRNDEGRLIIGENGLPRLNTDTMVLMGNGLPDFIAGLTNDFSFKNFGLSFMFEWKKGGDVIDVSRAYSLDNGQLEETLGRYQRVVFDGVKEDGTENDIAVEITPSGFYRNANIYRYAPEAFLQDASWIRLRSLSLSYDVPVRKLNIGFLEAARISLIGTNLFLNTPYNGWDPEANLFGANSNIYGFTGLRTPSTRTYSVKFNLTF